MGGVGLMKALGWMGALYSPDLMCTIAGSTGFLVFSPLGAMRGVSGWFREDMLKSGLLRESVRRSVEPSLSQLESVSSVDVVSTLKQHIQEGTFMGATFGTGPSASLLRGVSGIFMPGTAAMASRVSELLEERAHQTHALKPDVVVATAVEGLLEGTVSDKTDTWTMLTFGAFAAIVTGAVAVDYFVIRKVGENVDAVKERVGEKKKFIQREVDAVKERVDEGKDRARDVKREIAGSLSEKWKSTKEKLSSRRD